MKTRKRSIKNNEYKRRHQPEGRYTEEGKEVIDDSFKPLEKYAILEHIDILKRVLEMREERKVA